MPFFASKLPHGLKVVVGDTTIILAGANIGEELDNPSKNGSPRENRRRVYGFGLTELTEKQTEVFQAWRAEVSPKGRKGGFSAFDTGSILGPFGSRSAAEKECASIASVVLTGFEGVDPEKEAKKKGGVETVPSGE